MRMEIVDDEFTRLGVLNEYTMIQYTEKYSGVGSFELKCALNNYNVDLIRSDRILWIDEGHAGIIQYIEKSSENEITAKGSMLTGMLKWRVVPLTYEAYKPVTEIFQELINSSFMTGDRKIKGFTFQKMYLYDSENIRYQSTGKQLSDEFSELGDTYDYGFDIALNMKEKSFDFVLYRGKDKTIGNTQGNDPVIFGTNFNNILNGEYIADSQSYRNYVYVAGAGEGKDRTVVEVAQQTGLTGFFRREVYIDARDIQKENIEQPLTDEEYKELLNQRGKSKLVEYKKIESYEAETRSDGYTAFQYGKDYNLGDTVTIVDSVLGVELSAKVTEVVVTYSEEGYTVEPVFGFGLPTLYSKIKKGVL